MDKLAKISAAAKQAGMSYGQYVATHAAEVAELTAEPVREGMRSCKHCGKVFYPGKYQSKKYCCDECRLKAADKRAYQKWKEKQEGRGNNEEL